VNTTDKQISDSSPEAVKTNSAGMSTVFGLKLIALALTGALLGFLTVESFKFLSLSQEYGWLMVLTGMTYLPYLMIVIVIAADITLIAVTVHVIASRNAPPDPQRDSDDDFL
jgi:hypothetical protein